jgi:hypothetical protein
MLYYLLVLSQLTFLLGILKLNITYLIEFELAYSFLDGTVLSALILLSKNFKQNACLMGFFKLVGPSFIESKVRKCII